MINNRIKSEYITQRGQHCGYVILRSINSEYHIELHLFGISCPVIMETETDRGKAEKIYSEMLSEYSY